MGFNGAIRGRNGVVAKWTIDAQRRTGLPARWRAIKRGEEAWWRNLEGGANSEKRAAGLETRSTMLGSIWGLGKSIGRQAIFPWLGWYRLVVVSLSVLGRVRGRVLS
jgi:hypothetical protein